MGAKLAIWPWRLLLLLPFVALVLAFECKTSSPSPLPVATALAPPRETVASAAPLPAPTAIDEAAFRTEDERNSIEVFQKVASATVFVTQKRLVLVDRFYGVEVPAGSGSGFIWDTAGHVVTNWHVIQGARALTVTLHDQSEYPAEVVGAERRKDVAVIKLVGAPPGLVPIVVARDHELQVGQKTLAIGNPFGLDHTLTTGVVSALGREVPGQHGVNLRDLIQTDATINPGNSGGPLLNSRGELIGMNTAIFSPSGASAGIGFAVPGTTIARVVPQIIATGKAEEVGFGVEIDPYQKLERRFAIKGVVILTVVPGTPAAQAGLQGLQRDRLGLSLGDIIVGVDDEKVDDYDDLYNILDGHQPGERVMLKVRRKNDVLSVELPLIRLP